MFKAFPDLEPNECPLYDIASREIAGIQVKSVTFRAGASEAMVSVYRPALRPSPLTWFVILLEDEAGHPSCRTARWCPRRWLRATSSEVTRTASSASLAA